MRLRWTTAASADLQSISDYLKEHHPSYRQSTLRKIYTRLKALKHAPYVGRPGIESGSRELFFLSMPYVAVYRVREDTIEVVRIYHTSQARP